MQAVVINVGTVDEFFNRVRKSVQQINRGEVPEPSFTITFEDPDDMKDEHLLEQALTDFSRE